MTPVPLISVAGTPAEYGAAYGAAAAGMIATNIELYQYRFEVTGGWDVAAVRAAGQRFRESTVEYHPRIAAALDAMATAAGVDIYDVYAINARTELLVGARAGRRSGSGRGLGRWPGDDGECTAIGVLDTHTADGHLLLGQNWDWHPDQRDAMLLLRTTDEYGHSVLTLTEAGMLAKAGLNSAGVGLCVNLIGCDQDGIPHSGPVGVPYHVLMRAALEADSIGAAIMTTIGPPRSCSVNLLLGQRVDGAPGEVIDLELAPDDAGWRHPSGGVLAHANHFESGVAVYDTIKDIGGSSLFRADRARRLLAPAAEARKVTEDDLIALFRDHGGYPTAICRHVLPDSEPLVRSETVYSVLIDLSAGRMAVAAGPPCGHDYTWVPLDA